MKSCLVQKIHPRALVEHHVHLVLLVHHHAIDAAVTVTGLVAEARGRGDEG